MSVVGCGRGPGAGLPGFLPSLFSSPVAYRLPRFGHLLACVSGAYVILSFCSVGWCGAWGVVIGVSPPFLFCLLNSMKRSSHAFSKKKGGIACLWVVNLCCNLWGQKDNWTD